MRQSLQSLPHFVYRLFARDGTLLYIGVAVDLERRLERHRKTQPWAAEIHSVSSERFANHDSAEAHEHRAIRDETPRYNGHRYERSDKFDPTRPHLPNNGYPDDWSNLNIWLPPELRNRLKMAAATGDENQSEIVRTAIESELTRRGFDSA